MHTQSASMDRSLCTANYDVHVMQRIDIIFHILRVMITPTDRPINHSWNHLSSLGSIHLNCCHPGAYRANQTQQPTLPSQVPIYSWVERSNYGKVSCWRTQAPWSQPGFEPTFWWLVHQNTNPMDETAPPFHSTMMYVIIDKLKIPVLKYHPCNIEHNFVLDRRIGERLNAHSDFCVFWQDPC